MYGLWTSFSTNDAVKSFLCVPTSNCYVFYRVFSLPYKGRYFPSQRTASFFFAQDDWLFLLAFKVSYVRVVFSQNNCFMESMSLFISGQLKAITLIILRFCSCQTFFVPLLSLCIHFIDLMAPCLPFSFLSQDFRGNQELCKHNIQ